MTSIFSTSSYDAYGSEIDTFWKGWENFSHCHESTKTQYTGFQWEETSLIYQTLISVRWSYDCPSMWWRVKILVIVGGAAEGRQVTGNHIASRSAGGTTFNSLLLNSSSFFREIRSSSLRFFCFCFGAESWRVCGWPTEGLGRQGYRTS